VIEIPSIELDLIAPVLALTFRHHVFASRKTNESRASSKAACLFQKFPKMDWQ